MSFRSRFVVFMFLFLATASILGGGAFYIFSVLGDSIDVLERKVEGYSKFQEMRGAVRGFLRATTGWALTGGPAYKGRYRQSLSKVRSSFVEVDSLGTEGLGIDRRLIDAIDSDFQSLNSQSKVVMSSEMPVGNIKVLKALRKMESVEAALFKKLDEAQNAYISYTGKLVRAGKTLRVSMTLYLSILIAFSLVSTGFLMVFIKRMLDEPLNEMLEATARVASGDLAYRMATTRTDEYGTIARRFDTMVGSLEESSKSIKGRLKETELFLDVSTIASLVPESTEALDLIAFTVAEKMKNDFCAIYLLSKGKKSFALRAANIKGPEVEHPLSVEAGIAATLSKELKPLIVEGPLSPDEFGEAAFGQLGSLLAAPVLKENVCVGILMLGRGEPGAFREEEKDTAMILAHTIGVAVRNMELYEATISQLRQLTVLYELSRTLTSVYRPESVLETIATEIAKLINASGCAIRLLEDGVLKTKSYSGPPEKYPKEDLPVGKGIAGWVVKHGKSVFIEDVSKVSGDMRDQLMAQRSAISVPLKVRERIIGTLGLFDKLGPRGIPTAFSPDDLSVAEGFASISAVAIEKARMQEQEKKREAEVLEAKKRLDLLFESVQGGLITLDSKFNVIAANRFVERWVDQQVKDIIGHSAIEIFHKKKGICPHCAAVATFDTGDTNSITQSSGLNYAELTSYPRGDEHGNIVEAVVFIQDITDRVLYQEEIMGLYKEGTQTRDYLESLINNSADAIVVTDLQGSITSWNPAAQRIYGYTMQEVQDGFMPFVPEQLVSVEKDNIEKVKKGESLSLETLRVKKDGTAIEIRLTLSPIKEANGKIVGVSGISRDITTRKKMEKELIRRNQELSRLFFISSAMRSTLELEKLLRMVLTAVTISDGLGFNRAILFLLDDEGRKLHGAMAVGPANSDEAWKIWGQLSVEERTLPEIMQDIADGPQEGESFLSSLSEGIEVSLHEESVLASAARDKKAFNVTDVLAEPLSDEVLVKQLGTQAYAVVPLVSRDKVMGVLWVDNLFNRRPITEEDMKFLHGFSDQVASAIEGARLFEKVSLAEAELENIFRSITDMMYLTDRDYTLKNVNEAVIKKVGKPREEIIGKKCYQVFHGMDEPWPMCPHHNTLETMEPSIKELEDPHLNGTFLTSTSPLLDSEGKFLGTVHLVRDITEMKVLRERLLTAERMASLGEVAAKVAHEIRNPLVSVGGFAKRLEDKLEGNLREYASIISKEVGRLEDILKDILGFVRESMMVKRKVGLNTLIEDILSLVESETAEKGNSIQRHYSDPDIDVIIDPDRMKEAVLNILSNANQATDGGVITVRTYVQDGHAALEVSDTGCGIDDETRKRIFDPFFTTRPSGTGLGLAITKRIVQEHGGEVSISDNLPLPGTKFIIMLPLKEDL